LGQGAIATTTNTGTISSLNAIQATTINITGANPSVVTAVGASADATGFGTTARSIAINASTATNTVIFAAGTALQTQPLTMTGSSTAASTLTGGIGADSITGGSAADSLTGGASADTIDGGLGADNLLGGTGNDSITAGEGADAVTPGQGADAVILTETTAAIDNVILELAAVNGVDTITGFASGTGIDTVTFQTADTTVATAAGAAAFETITPVQVTAATYNLGAINAGAANAMDVYEFIGANEANGDLSLSTTGSELLKLLGTADSAATSITTEANGDAFFIIAYDNGNAYMYLSSAGDNAIALASEITLVAVFSATTTGNFAAGDILTVG
jgi:Ca2+-binding RTX toxin-like protein